MGNKKRGFNLHFFSFLIAKKEGNTDFVSILNRFLHFHRSMIGFNPFFRWSVDFFVLLNVHMLMNCLCLTPSVEQCVTSQCRNLNDAALFNAWRINFRHLGLPFTSRFQKKRTLNGPRPPKRPKIFTFSFICGNYRSFNKAEVKSSLSGKYFSIAKFQRRISNI